MKNRFVIIFFWTIAFILLLFLACLNAFFRIIYVTSITDRAANFSEPMVENEADIVTQDNDLFMMATYVAQTIMAELTATVNITPLPPVLPLNPPEVTEVIPEPTEVPQPPTEVPQKTTEIPPEPTEVPPEPVENPQVPIVTQLPTPAGNFVNNPSFDEGTSLLPSYWEWLPYTGACSKRVYDDPANAHTGSKYLATGSSNDYPACLGVYQDIYIGAINPGDYFTMSIWLKSPWQPQVITYHLEWTGGSSPVSIGQAISLNNTWQCFQVGLYIPNPGDNTHFRISVELPNKNLDVNIDDVLLYPGELKACP